MSVPHLFHVSLAISFFQHCSFCRNQLTNQVWEMSWILLVHQRNMRRKWSQILREGSMEDSVIAYRRRRLRGSSTLRVERLPRLENSEILKKCSLCTAFWRSTQSIRLLKWLRKNMGVQKAPESYNSAGNQSSVSNSQKWMMPRSNVPKDHHWKASASFSLLLVLLLHHL